MTLTTTTTISAPINVQLQMNLLRTARPYCPYFAGSVPADITQHGGTFTAKWRRYENLTPTTTALTELTGSIAFPTRVGSQPSITDLTATVSKYGDFLILNEEVDLLNFNNQAAELTKRLGEQAGRSLNRLQRNVLEDSLTAILGLGPTGGLATTATNVSGSSAAGFLTRGQIQNITNVLNRNDASLFEPMTTGNTSIGTTPIRNAYWGFCHVDTEEDIRVLTGFVPVEQYAGQTDVDAREFGAIGGVRWVSTTESSIDTGSGASATASATGDGGHSTSNRTDLYNTVVIGQDCHGSVGFGFEHVKEKYTSGDKLPGIQVINHERGSAGSADPLNEVMTMGWKTWHAGVILNSNWGRVQRHAASLLRPNG